MMKRFLKGLVFCAGMLAIPAALNHLIFKLADKKEKTPYKEGVYKWRYGNVRYVVAGTGDPVLLIHGIGVGSSLMEWEKNLGRLSAKYKVYAIDLLGFGHSDKPNISYSAYLYITLINNFIRDIIGRRTHIIASSNAGAYAVMAYDFEPSNFNKLLLVSPTGVGVTPMPTHQNVWQRWVWESPIVGTAMYNLLASKAYIHWFLRKFCFQEPQNAKLNDGVIYNMAHVGGPNARLPIAAFMTNFLNVPIEHVLPHIDIPVHLVWGDENEINPIRNAQAFMDCRPNTQLSIFQGAKLLPHSESPGKFYQICREFFG